MQSGTHKAARPPLPTPFLFGSVMTSFPGPSTSNERRSWLFSLRLRCACSPISYSDANSGAKANRPMELD